MASWFSRFEQLASVSARQLFFVGGAPRSGTTWLQEMLDAHPEVCCKGEGLLAQQLAAPLDALMAKRSEAIADKNRTIFRHRAGYPLPDGDDADVLLGTGILLALQRQGVGPGIRAIGEKTPENVFLFPRLHQIFPAARFVAIAREPRDVLTSAWHFFPRQAAADEVAAKVAFIRVALPSLESGARAMIDFADRHPDETVVLTYEGLRSAPAEGAARLYRFLGVSDEAALVADCVARTSFAAMAGGRAAGTTADGSFFRKGVVGDWRSTLTPAMSDLVIETLGWMYARFGWDR